MYESNSPSPARRKQARDKLDKLLEIRQDLDSAWLVGYFVGLHSSYLQNIQYIQCAIYNIQYTIYNIQYLIYNIQYTIYNKQYNIYNNITI